MRYAGILARAARAGNAAPRPGAPRLIARAAEFGGPLRTAITLAVCAVLIAGLPLPLSGLLFPVTMLFIGEARLSPRSAGPQWPMVMWRFLNTLLATATLLYLDGADWIAGVALGLFVVSSSGMVGRRGLAVVTAVAAVMNLVLPAAADWLRGAAEPFALSSQSILVSAVVLPATAALLHVRSRRLVEAREVLKHTVADLEQAQTELQASEHRLQEWNQQLNSAIEAQTAQLEERNRYLSIINAVSFALAEPMDDFRSLERAARLVARLMGARAAQAIHRAATGEGAHLFVTVAPEDIHAPRLPESLLRRVAETGAPVISSIPGEQDLPDLGEPYAIVPIAARGHVSGAFALIGTGNLEWADQERHLLLLIGREIGVALENMRLYRDAIERVKREETAGGAARLLDVPDRREHAVHEALELVGQALDAWDIALVTIDDARGAPAVVAALREGGDGNWLAPIVEALPDRVAGQTAPVILGAGGDGPLSDALEARGIGTLVLVPVVSLRGSSVLPQGDAGASPQASFQRVMSGVIVVAIEAGVPWRPASSELVSSFAYSLARRLESDELVALQQQRIRELSGLADVARTMQSGADVDRLYAGFAHALTGLLHFERLYIARIDEYGQMSGVPAFAADGTREERGFSPGDAAHRWFSLRAPTAWGPEIGPLPSFVHGEEGQYLVVPMRPKGQVLGVVAFSVTAGVAGDQLRIVEQAVEQLALALDSAMLYHQATERASHIQALSNLARIVASVVDLREAFAAFAEEVRWLIPFDRAVMLLIDESESEVQPYATYPEESLRTAATPLRASIASAAIEAGGAVFLRRSSPDYAWLDWDILGPDVAEVAAVPVRNGVRTAAVFALVHTTNSETAPDLNALDEVAGLLGVTIERLRLYERAEYSANHDLLTGLPNYRYLQERLYNLRAGITEPGESAVLMVDMDGLKIFNDTLGHEAGDLVIRLVARELRATCRASDFVARTGGDEFVIVMEGVGPEQATAAAERVHAALRDAHLEIPGAPARLGVSVGIATAPADATSANRLLHAADQAMYAAKFSGGHRTRLARDHGEDSPTRSIPQRDTHLVETMVRTAIDGATDDERFAITVAQRWVVGVISHLPGGVDAAPWVRMVVAQDGLASVAHPRGGRDQDVARFFLANVRDDWSARSDEVAAATVSLTPVALRLARLSIPALDPSGRAFVEAVHGVRAELGDGASDLHDALLDFALAERLDRRRTAA